MGSNIVGAEWGGDKVRHSEDSFSLEASALRMSPQHSRHASSSAPSQVNPVAVTSCVLKVV